MRKSFFAAFALMFLVLGCASVQVKAPKEPIKVDISMRLDVYQHVEKEIDNIENMVSSTQTAAGLQSFNFFGTECAYAQEGYGPEVNEAVSRRKARYAEIMQLESQGTLGENRNGLLEVRSPAAVSEAILELVSGENSDRMAIYRSIARTNAATAQEIQAIYAKRLQKGAPSGTPIEVIDETTAKASWQRK